MTGARAWLTASAHSGTATRAARPAASSGASSQRWRPTPAPMATISGSAPSAASLPASETRRRMTTQPTLGGARARDAEPLHAPVQGLAAEAELAGGLADDAAGPGQRQLDRRAVELGVGGRRVALEAEVGGA